MLTKLLDTPLAYDGSQLRSLWAFRNFGLLGDSIVAFKGPCRVGVSEMVDMEDVRAGEFIFSEEMLHFIVEHFETDLEKAVVRQRLLMALIGETLACFGAEGFKRQGDDLYLGEAKLSVSIATLSPVSTLIHTGLNIVSLNTPVATVGLADLGVDADVFARSIVDRYAAEVESIRAARCKVRGVP